MWWSSGKKKEEKSEPAKNESANDDDDTLTSALDTLGAVIRCIGVNAVDTEAREAKATTDACEGWARHVLVLAPQPGSLHEGEVSRRDWGGVRKFTSTVLKDQTTHVVKAIDDLRQVVWTFVRTLNEALGDEDVSDEHVTEQLDRLRAAVASGSPDELKREALAVATSVTSILEHRRKAQRSRMRQLASKLKAVGKQLEEARREGALDPLTKLFNRKAFDDYLSRTADMNGLFETPACLLFIDLDHFKAVNDTYGHRCGDYVLKQMSDRLTRSFMRKTDFVARFGGEEFAVILGDTVLKDGEMLAKRLVDAVRTMPLEFEGKKLSITTSVGVSEIGVGEAAEQWLGRTDEALYEAKRAGRDRVQVAKPPRASTPMSPAPIVANVSEKPSARTSMRT